LCELIKKTAEELPEPKTKIKGNRSRHN